MDRSCSDRVDELCSYITESTDPEKLRWGWGEGLLIYALLEWDRHRGCDKGFKFAERYYKRFMTSDPEIDCSDRISPALGCIRMEELSGNKRYGELVRLALKYIDESEKIVDQIPNHFGTGKDSTYPQSIWVDSLMMLSVFTGLCGRTYGDDRWCEFAAGQPGSFAKRLMDPCGCWYHSYYAVEGYHYPRRRLFWGRGNGWVALSIPMIAEQLGDRMDTGAVREIYIRSMDGILKYQGRDGSFRTIINHPETYRETSASALVAAGLYKAVKLGFVPDAYLERADRSFDYCMRHLKKSEKGVFLTGISRPTVPMQRIPYLWYAIMPRRSNFNYGVAAMILASIYRDELMNGEQ